MKHLHRISRRLITESDKPLLGDDKKLYRGKYMDIKLHDDWYEYCHNHLEGVLALCIDRKADKFLMRYEHCPIHSQGLYPTSLTGGIEKGDSALETVYKEVEEESGYVIRENEVIELGHVFNSKATDTKTFLFVVVMDGLADSVKHYGESDGTKGEEGAYCLWQPVEDIAGVTAPALHSAYIRYLAKQ